MNIRTAVKLVSVIIPNYNHGPFLKQRIDSILYQTYSDFNITILDDCSSDDSKSIIEQYREHPKVANIIYNETNSGSTFKQWQKGIEAVNGDWIWIAESDDWCENNLLQTLVDGITENTTLSIAQSLVVADSGEVLWNSKADKFAEEKEGLTFVRSKMLLDNFGVPNASMCIFKRAAYFSIDKEYTEFKFCGDWLFWILIALQGDVFISGKVLNYFRKHDKDISGGAYKNGVSYLEFFKLIDSLERRAIIDKNIKHDLLAEKFRIFLRDERMDDNIKVQVQKRFQSLINHKYYTSLWKEKTIRFLRKHV